MKLALLILLQCCYLANSVSCKEDSDCTSLNYCKSKVCTHKDLWPMAGSEWGGIVLVLIIGVFATAGGAGGSVACTSFSLLLFY